MDPGTMTCPDRECDVIGEVMTQAAVP
jgi:hypothetical protein